MMMMLTTDNEGSAGSVAAAPYDPPSSTAGLHYRYCTWNRMPTNTMVPISGMLIIS